MAETDSPATILWYDLETTGTDSRRDRIMQFAAQRTDWNLNPVRNSFSTYVRLPPECVPSPAAVRLTKIDPLMTNTQGITELELTRMVYSAFNHPNTTIIGYNNIRFDNEFIRNLFYRHLLNPYVNTKRGIDTRDLFPWVLAAKAYAPEAMNWPIVDGKISLQLARLADANGFESEQAHDALADVVMSISLAHLLFQSPCLRDDFVLTQTKDYTKNTRTLLNPRQGNVLLYTASYLDKQTASTVPIICFGRNQIGNRNQYFVVDLNGDVEPLKTRSAAEIKAINSRAAAKRRAGTPATTESVRLRSIVINKRPIVKPLKEIDDETLKRFHIDRSEVLRKASVVKAILDLEQRMTPYFDRQGSVRKVDVSEQIYEAFMPDPDEHAGSRFFDDLVAERRSNPPRFLDERFNVLSSRLAARYQKRPEHDPHQIAYRQYVRERLHDTKDGLNTRAEKLKDEFAQARDTTEKHCLSNLAQYYREIAHAWSVPLDTIELS